MKQTICFTLNGSPTQIEVIPDKRLIDFLREDLRLTGTKEGCGVGECGACTVLLDGQAVNACLVLTGQLPGKSLYTIEGLVQEGQLDVIQQAFYRNTAVQCGYCTPGMIMSAKALLLQNPNPTEAEIKTALAGNICRCSGYKEILQAVKDSAEELTRGDSND